MTYLLGYDIGSSSVKATLLEAESGKIISTATSPDKKEMEITAHKSGWAEQDPQIWWKHVKIATAELLSKSKTNTDSIHAIGISYQMHGLVVVDKNIKLLRPAIIWCDGRAAKLGDKAFHSIGEDKCLNQLLNSPGNFTSSKLKWVKDNEPEIYERIYKVMLPGDYIAALMTGEIKTTISGLSECVLWDFRDEEIAQFVLDYYGISPDLIPDSLPAFSIQGKLTKKAAEELGLRTGIKVSYRAGDQPNNALSLNVLEPGEIAATAGTSGVVYAVSDKLICDTKSRVNTFIHVHHTLSNPRYGILLCINGTGILNSWVKRILSGVGDVKITYEEVNKIASQAPVGSEGLVVIPFGNGAERVLENHAPGASICNLRFNTHGLPHYLRAVQEGIVFALNYGVNIMRNIGVEVKTVKAGHTNMFLSPLFSEAFATITGVNLELYNTDGSQGAARAAGIGAGIYKTFKDAYNGLKKIKVFEPDLNSSAAYREAYERWLKILQTQLEQGNYE
ncbi:MAG: FGGY family carbohydrate kinase [Planctomycetota bacterium]